MTVFQVTITKFIDEDTDTKTYGLYSSFSKAMEATKSIKLNSKYGEYLEVRQIDLDYQYPESPIVVHSIDSTESIPYKDGVRYYYPSRESSESSWSNDYNGFLSPGYD